jgi:hypothetical protein
VLVVERRNIERGRGREDATAPRTMMFGNSKIVSPSRRHWAGNVAFADLPIGVQPGNGA